MATAPDSPPNISSPRFGARVQVEELPKRLDEVEQDLRQGCIVELVSNGRLVAELRSPASPYGPEEIDPNMPDFMARMKEMWGDRTFGDSTRWIREDRDSG
jgi:hypothetical protein